jgi:23S rRNA pseudouridine2605 synthase
LLLTNDGKLAHRLAHPRYGVEKEYRVRARGRITSETITALENGIQLEEGITSPARVLFPDARAPGLSVFHIVLHEGWNREVRRMCAAIGLEVLELTRVRYGCILLGDLAPGGMRRLTERECAALRD